MEKQSQELVKNIIDWVESSSDFVKGQFPDFVDQFIKISLINTWFDVTLFAVVFLLLIIFAIYIYRKSQLKNDDHSTWSGFIIMARFMLPCFIFISLISLVHSAQNLLTIYVAPKVYILSHLKDFLK